MDGLFLDVGLPADPGPYVPPVCLSPSTAQILAVALVLLVGIGLRDIFWPERDRRR